MVLNGGHPRIDLGGTQDLLGLPAPPYHSIASQLQAFYDPWQQRGEVPLAREQRKLAAILAADVVGYSRLMGRDEGAARLREHRKECLEPALARYGGRRRRSRCRAGDHACRVNRASTSYLGALFCGLVP
jgi:class 3 adenylate cyclase